ncbi:putative transporter, partial [Pasteurella multocida subsp. multocida str. Anand1_cattle]
HGDSGDCALCRECKSRWRVTYFQCCTCIIGSVCALVFANALSYLPLSSMAALLLVVAWNMANVPQIIQLIRRSGRNEIAVLLTCLILTVIFDMVIAITVGVLLASLLFIRTIAEMTKSIEIAHPEDLNDV